MTLEAINIILQLADAYTTMRVIKQGGRELNPLLLWIAEKLKSVTNARWAWLGVKCAVAGALIYLCNGEVVPLLGLAAIQGFIVYRNWKQIK